MVDSDEGNSYYSSTFEPLGFWLEDLWLPYPGACYKEQDIHMHVYCDSLSHLARTKLFMNVRRHFFCSRRTLLVKSNVRAEEKKFFDFYVFHSRRRCFHCA